MASVRIATQDLNKLIKDLNDVRRNLGRIFERSGAGYGLLGRVGKHYARSYNDLMRREGHPSLAKAKVSSGGRSWKNPKGGTSHGVRVSVPKEAVEYDISKSHYVSVWRRGIRAWVKKHWRFGRIAGRRRWHPTLRVSGLSKVRGTKANPRGTLYVTSHLRKKGWSIGPGPSGPGKAFENMLVPLSREIRDFVDNKVMRRSIEPYLRGKKYFVTIDLSI